MQFNRFNLAELRKQVRPFRLHWFPRLRSTNDHAARLRRSKRLFAPAILLTSRQTHGRGRGANAWWSNSGCLTATFVLPGAEHLRPHQVPLLAGLAVRSALVQLSDVDSIQLKWPNDLLWNDRKLAGVLCERVHGADLIGVGVNVNLDLADAPPRLQDRCASLLQIIGAPTPMGSALAAIGRQIHARLSRPNEHHFGAVLREYDRHHALVGRRVAVNPVSGTSANGQRHKALTHAAKSASTPPEIQGVCVGLDTIGRLLLRDDVTLHRVIAGTVSMH